MSAADLARLELAKRAYRAVEPSAAEVQRGVRRARLGLQRPRRRSTWLSKTLVAVVLAMGGLAYAKPQALGELVQAARHRGAAAPKQGGAGGGALPPTLPEPARNTAQQAQGFCHGFLRRRSRRHWTGRTGVGLGPRRFRAGAR